MKVLEMIKQLEKVENKEQELMFLDAKTEDLISIDELCKAKDHIQLRGNSAFEELHPYFNE